jgi:hypothetical protein
MNFLLGLGLGAGFMYMFDPVQGRQRRALLLTQLGKYGQRGENTFDQAAHDLRHRARGVRAEMPRWVNGKDVLDTILLERVRAQMERVVLHPEVIEVTVHQGYVTLSGPVMADEEDELLSAVAAIQGVVEVENQLEVASEYPAYISGVQRDIQRHRQARQSQTDWSPTARLLMGVGAALVLYGTMGGGLLGLILGGLGLGLCADELAKS